MASQGLRLVVAGLALGGLAVLATVSAQGGIDGTVTGKAQDGQGTYVVATTEVGGLEFQRYVPTEEWTVVQEGDAVVYDVLSGETSIYTWERGSLIWRG